MSHYRITPTGPYRPQFTRAAPITNYVKPKAPPTDMETVLSKLDFLINSIENNNRQFNNALDELRAQNELLAQELYEVKLQNIDMEARLKTAIIEYSVPPLVEIESEEVKEEVKEEVICPDPDITYSTNDSGINMSTKNGKTQMNWINYYSIPNNTDILNKIGEDKELMRKYSRALQSVQLSINKGIPLKKGTPASVASNDALVVNWYKIRNLKRPTK